MNYYYIIMIVMSFLICYKWGDWRNWENYYSTILFFILGDSIYGLLFRNTLLWTYEFPLLNHTLISLIIGFTVFPATVMVFIPLYPKGLVKQAAYILICTFVYSLGEYIAYKIGAFSYYNGWNLYYSVIFCLIMFPLLYLHYKKPLWAWGGALTFLIVCIIFFDVDIMGLI